MEAEIVALGGRGQGDDGEEAAKKEHKEEEERWRVAAYKKGREKKLKRAHRGKAAMEENLDALSKGKWSRYTQ